MKKVFMMFFASVMFLAGCTATGAQDVPWTDESLKDVNANEFILSDLKGKPTVIKVWASWCSICLSGLRQYNELSAMDIDANVISIVEPGRGGEMNEEDFSKWFLSLDDYKDMTVLLDTIDLIKNEFGVRAYPTYFYLDADANIVKIHPGHQDNDEIIQALESIREG